VLRLLIPYCPHRLEVHGLASHRTRLPRRRISRTPPRISWDSRGRARDGIRWRIITEPRLHYFTPGASCGHPAASRVEKGFRVRHGVSRGSRARIAPSPQPTLRSRHGRCCRSRPRAERGRRQKDVNRDAERKIAPTRRASAVQSRPRLQRSSSIPANTQWPSAASVVITA